MQFVSKLINYIFGYLLVIEVIYCQNENKVEVRLHQIYRDLECNYPKITSMTKLKDSKYFVSTNGQKFWLISDLEGVTQKNSRDLNTITTEWEKIDASFYVGVNVECGLSFRDKLILVNFNDKSQQNELIVGSLVDWEWTQTLWKNFSAFNLTTDRIDWTKSIDGIAVIDETIVIFQNNSQIRVDCYYNHIIQKWIYSLNNNFREIPINGPIDALYFDDRNKDILPIYAIRGDINFICYLKQNNDEFPTCEYSPLIESTMAPRPYCSLVSDPNENLHFSMGIQMLISLILVITLIIFSALYLWNLWHDFTDETTFTKDNLSKVKTSHKINKK